MALAQFWLRWFLTGEDTKAKEAVPGRLLSPLVSAAISDIYSFRSNLDNSRLICLTEQLQLLVCYFTVFVLC